MLNIIDQFVTFVGGPEIVLAGFLVLIVVALLLAARSKTLPVKGIFYLVATLFGVLGIWFFKSRFLKKMKEKIKEVEKLEQNLAEIKKTSAAEKEKVVAVEAALRNEIAELRIAKEALIKQIAILSAKSKEEKDIIDKLHGDALFDYVNNHVIR